MIWVSQRRLDTFPSAGNTTRSCARGREAERQRGWECHDTKMARNGDNFLSTGTDITSVWLVTPFWKISAWPLCTLEIMAIGVKVEDLESRNTPISQWASAVRSGRGVLSVTRGLRQPPTSCFPCLWQLTRERVSVHPEWLFQPPHLDAGAEPEQKMNRFFVSLAIY